MWASIGCSETSLLRAPRDRHKHDPSGNGPSDGDCRRGVHGIERGLAFRLKSRFACIARLEGVIGGSETLQRSIPMQFERCGLRMAARKRLNTIHFEVQTKESEE